MIAEPKKHVTKENFSRSINLAQRVGFEIIDTVEIALSNTVLLRKQLI